MKLTNNSALSDRGGGALAYGARSVDVSRANVTLNSAGGPCAASSGGGLAFVGCASVNVTESGFAGNLAWGDAGALLGAGVDLLTVKNCAVSGNAAAGNGGGIGVANASIALLRSNIVRSRFPLCFPPLRTPPHQPSTCAARVPCLSREERAIQA